MKLRSFAPDSATPLASEPDRAELRFAGNVEEAFREAALRDPTGEVVDAEVDVAGDLVTIDLPERMVDGTWTVEYALTGADGHPIRAEQTFSMRAASSHADHAAAYPGETVEAVALAGRVVFFLALLLFVGAGVFALRAAPGFVPVGWGVLALHVVTGALVVLGTHAALSERLSAIELLDPREWIGAAVSTGGRGHALAAIATLLALRIGRRELRPRQWQARAGAMPLPVLGLLVAAAAAPTLSSHAMSSDLAAVRVPLDMLHIVAASIWIGGLVQLLALTVERRAGNPGIPGAVERYSQLAFGSVVTLVVTGSIAAWIELGGSPSELFGSAYGRLVLVKLVLLGLTIPLARANQVRNVPDLRRGGPETLTRLRRFVAWEFVVVVWVVVATAALVYETPPDQAPHGGGHAMAAGGRD